MTGTQWSSLAWSVRSSAEVSVHVSSQFLALSDRRDRQSELRIAAPWKSTTSIKQQNTAILACIHVNGPGGRLIQPRITIRVTFARFSQCSDNGVLRITLRLA